MDRGKKETIVDKLHEKLSSAQLVARFGFSGLTVEEFSSLRREMGKVGGTTLAVVKNTLAEIASRETSTAPLFQGLQGPNGFLVSETDIVTPAKILTEFAKKHPNFLVHDGILGGKVVKASQIKALADMPSREELLAKLLYVFNAPAQNFVQVLAAVPRSLLNVLNAVKEQKEKAAA